MRPSQRNRYIVIQYVFKTQVLRSKTDVIEITCPCDRNRYRLLLGFAVILIVIIFA